MNDNQLTNAWNLITHRLVEWYQVFFINLPNVIMAVVVMIAFWLLAKLVRNLAQRLVGRFLTNSTLERLFVSLIYTSIILLGTFVALGILNLDKTVTTLLAGAGIVGLALGFAFQDIAENFIAGIIMALRRPLRIGDLVETNEQLGIVESIHLRTSELRSLQGQEIVIPNKQIFQNTLLNYSRHGHRRIDLEVGISYGDDLASVRRVTLEAVRSVKGVLTDHPIDLYFTEFGNSSINFQVRFWIEFARQTDFLGARSEAIMRIKSAFDRNGITIPFPIRTLDFGIKGGERLAEVLDRYPLMRGGRDGA